MKKNKAVAKLDKKISSTDRLEDLLEETERELAELEPKIEKLEKQLEKLKELKLAKQKLITLKLSIKSILNNFSENKVYASVILKDKENLTKMLSSEAAQNTLVTSRDVTKTIVAPNATLPAHTSPSHAAPLGTFVPERAFAEVSEVLRKKTSINFELFRAVVFSGGRASTEAIKQYLVENNIKQPGNGEGFESVELTDISSRINYLVRKGVVTPDGRGAFRSCFGWL